jgi:formylglycine-generating enzyme required for sulfatase activity
VDNLKIGDTYPAVGMSWRDATAFCQKLTQTETDAKRLPPGWIYALPTEAQWEYACRGGTTSAYWFGDEPDELEQHEWCGRNSGILGEKLWERSAHPVGQMSPNPFGLYDMHGNVEEYCRDVFLDKPTTGLDPEAKLAPHERVFDIPRVGRGGSFVSQPSRCRSAVRFLLGPNGSGGVASGFRVAMVAQPAEPGVK